MKITQLIEGSKPQKIPASKPRNFVAKNATGGGAGAHKDKKKAAKQGDVKHKNKDMEMAEDQLDEYGDTTKGQKMLTKVQKRAVDRVTSKKADTDPKYAKKNSDTANRAWDRMSDKDLEEAGANTKSFRSGYSKRKETTPLSAEEQAAKDKAKSDKWLEKERAKMAAKKNLKESSEADRIQALYDKLERYEERLGHDDPRVQALRAEIRGMTDQYRVVGQNTANSLRGVAEGEIERQHGDLKPWAYWNSPNRVAQKLYQIYGGEPIDKSAVVKLWKEDGPDRMTKFMMKPDVAEILSAYQAMSTPGDLLEGVWGDTAKLIGIPAVAGAMAIGAQHYDDKQPHVEIGDKSIRLIAQPGWGTVPDNAMLITGKDGKEYRVWRTSGKGSGHVWLAAPAEKVKEDFTDTVKTTVNKVGDTLANVLPKDMKPFDNETAAKNSAAQKPTTKLASLKEDIEEAMYRRPGSPTAYDRDYRSSVSGMGHKQSIAYQQDGGANDEGWGEEPYQNKEDKPVLKGYYFYDVPPGKEGLAAIYGIKKTKSGKWAKALYSTSGRSYNMQKREADREFGPGKWWAPR